MLGNVWMRKNQDVMVLYETKEGFFFTPIKTPIP